MPTLFVEPLAQSMTLSQLATNPRDRIYYPDEMYIARAAVGEPGMDGMRNHSPKRIT